ncbi:MAG: rod shape-determining protein RodA [Acidimicrobiales bacterium]
MELARRNPARRLGRDPAAAWRHLDLVLIGCVAAVAALGVLMVYSATRGPGGADPFDTTFLKRQALFVVVGFGVMAVVSAIDYRRFRDLAPFLYVGVVALLLLVVSPLGSNRKGAQAWFDLGLFQLQPSEFTKLAVVIGLAAILANFRDELDLRRITIILGLVVMPLGMIMLQPDLGTALIIVAITAGVLLVGGADHRHLLALVGSGVLAAVVVLNTPMLEDYQRARLTTFLSQDSDRSETARGEAYNLNQSKIAIGAGGAFGRGLFGGSQTRLRNVPEQHTDFIFTAVGEELGFVGAGTLLALFGILCWRIWRTAQLARDDYGTLVCAGVLSMLLFQIFQNVGMTMGIMPITGIPLPFMSYGGSSTVASFAAMGLVLNVHSRRFA